MTIIKVKSIEPFTGERVTIKVDGQEKEFCRYGPNCWTSVIGETEESEYWLESLLETAYNNYLENK